MQIMIVNDKKNLLGSHQILVFSGTIQHQQTSQEFQKDLKS